MARNLISIKKCARPSRKKWTAVKRRFLMKCRIHHASHGREKKMAYATENELEAWTDQTLAKEINNFKKHNNFNGLIRFLEERLADENPCCVSNRARFWNELGLSRIEQEDLSLAETCFENALSLVPDYTAAKYNLATLAMKNGNPTVALELYNSILTDNPEHFNALFNAGLCCTLLDNKEGALQMFKQAAELRPEDGQVQYLTGENLLQLGRASEALPFFRAAYKQNHGHFETTQGLAIALLESRKYEEAISICDQAQMTFGPAMLPLQVKGDAMLALNRIEQAIQCHIDLAALDLDIRDFVVARIRMLAKENPGAFAEYAAIVRDRYPDFESFVGAALKKDN